jgi:hypothetical protein
MNHSRSFFRNALVVSFIYGVTEKNTYAFLREELDKM